jgi:hypothetical protein
LNGSSARKRGWKKSCPGTANGKIAEEIVLRIESHLVLRDWSFGALWEVWQNGGENLEHANVEQHQNMIGGS